jgi:hypothetical protein
MDGEARFPRGGNKAGNNLPHLPVLLLKKRESMFYHKALSRARDGIYVANVIAVTALAVAFIALILAITDPHENVNDNG